MTDGYLMEHAPDGDDDLEVGEPEDADDEDAHPPVELLELGEVLEWQRATTGAQDPPPAEPS